MIATFIFAAALSLASSNDYEYVSLPTNSTYTIDGIGVGPNGDYRMMRREDWLFLTECAREREVVSGWLSSTPTTNNAPTRTFTNAATICPWPDGIVFNALASQFLTIYGSVSNAVYVTKCPSAGTLAGSTKRINESYNSSFVFTNMYVGGVIPASRKLEAFNAIATSAGHSWILPYPEIVLGVLTNAYADVIANDRVTWRQSMKFADNGYSELRKEQKVRSAFASGYSEARDEFDYLPSVPYSEQTYRVPSWAWSTPYFFFDSRIWYYKEAYCGFSSSGEHKASGRGSSIEVSESLFDAESPGFAVMFPSPIGGAEIVEVEAAYAVLSVTHRIEKRPNGGSTAEYLTNVTKRVIKPVTLTQAASHNGLATYTFTMPVAETRTDVLAVANEQMRGANWLGEQIEYPQFPSTYERTAFNSSREYIIESIIIYPEAVIGVFKMRWHSRL